MRAGGVLTVVCGVLIGCPVPSGSDSGIADLGECFGSRPVRWVDVVSGSAPDALEWRWPAEDDVRWCTAAGACHEADSCAEGVCSHLQTGLAPNQRVFADFTRWDPLCRPATTRLSSAVIDTSIPAAWEFEQRDCDAADAGVNGVLVVAQRGAACRSSLLTLDREWSNGRYQVELRVLDSDPGFWAGLTLGGRRFLLTSDSNALFQAELRSGASDSVAARTLMAASGDWRAFRVVVTEDAVSWSEGLADGGWRERSRWSERTAPAAFGITASGTGRLEVRNVRVAALASTGWAPSSGRLGLDELDGGLASRELGTMLSAPCPVLPSCDAGCAPPAGATCRVLEGDARLGVSPPLGLSPLMDWTLSLRFATLDGGASVALPQATLLDGAEPGAWHLASWLFPARGGAVALTLDGVAVDAGVPWPPAEGARSLDGLALRGVVLQDLSIAAAPP